MLNTSMRCALIATATLSLSTLVFSAVAADGVKINELVIAKASRNEQREATLRAVTAFYDFWNTGDLVLLKIAIAPTFIDHTLPPGRPQGPTGPAFASEHFRVAVPDLKLTVEKMIVAGDYVTVHMTFTGHFTGKFGETQGKGQAISFIATDLVKVSNGLITDNWHIEDNLTLLQAMGVAKVG
jgi:predicted ester cyclase